MSERGQHRVDEGDEGERLDRWLSVHRPDLSRSQWQRLIEEGRVRVDGTERPARHRLHAGDRVDYEIPAPVEVDLEPDAGVPFEIVYEDEELAVVDKPAGVVVHPGVGNPSGTLVQGLLARLNSLSSVGGRARPGIVHRLDAGTSGLLVVAKTDRAHRGLQDQLRDRTLGRLYDALAWGAPDPPEGVIEAPLDRDPRNRRRRAVVEGGRAARTHYRRRESRAGIVWLSLRLETGRTHQIRVHLAHAGHPVFADELYGGDVRRIGGISPAFRPRVRRALKALERQALHARELHFVHPGDGREFRFESPWPADMGEAWKRLGTGDAAGPGSPR